MNNVASKLFLNMSKTLILEIFQNFKCPNIFKDQIHGK